MADNYVIDSSSIIDLFRWYPPDMEIFKPIWDKIEQIANSGSLVSHYEVYREIEKKSDMANEWCKKHKDIFFDLDEEQVAIFGEVREKYEEDYWNRMVTQPNPWADPWLVALAVQLKRRGELLGMGMDVRIITQENKNKRNNIPTIARAFGVKSLKLLEFFKDIGIK